MIGAIAGDIIGSYYEAAPTKDYDFEFFHKDGRFTDDTVMTVAVADWILHGVELTDYLHSYFHKHPQAGYGMSFTMWAGHRKREPYNSWGNGSAMRVSPVGFAFDSPEIVLVKAKESAEPTHNHEEGIRGAQATAACVFLARTKHDKTEIKRYVESEFGYDLKRSLADIRPMYSFRESCQESVPEAIIAFLESTDYESAIRNAVSLGGDADTMASIAGGIAEAFYGGVPAEIQSRAFEFLDETLITTIREFHETHLQS